MSDTHYYQLPSGALGSSHGLEPPDGAEMLDEAEYEKRLAESRAAAAKEQRDAFMERLAAENQDEGGAS